MVGVLHVRCRMAGCLVGHSRTYYVGTSFLELHDVGLVANAVYVVDIDND